MMKEKMKFNLQLHQLYFQFSHFFEEFNLKKKTSSRMDISLNLLAGVRCSIHIGAGGIEIEGLQLSSSN